MVGHLFLLSRLTANNAFRSRSIARYPSRDLTYHTPRNCQICLARSPYFLGWSTANLFVIRLQSTDIDGLSVPPIHAPYMMQYRNGLIGKHFKTLMQTMVFHVHEIVSADQFTLIKAIGSLGALLWVHEIGNMNSYLVRRHHQNSESFWIHTLNLHRMTSTSWSVTFLMLLH